MRLELLHEGQVALTLRSKLINILVNWRQRICRHIAHNGIEVDDLVEGALVIQLRQQRQVAIDIGDRSQEQLKLLRLKQVGTAH